MLLTLSLALAEAPLPTPEATPGSQAGLGYSGTALFPDARQHAPMRVEAAATGQLVAIQYTDTCLGAGCGGVSYELAGAPGVRLSWSAPADLRVEGQLAYSTAGDFIGYGALAWSTALSPTVRAGVFLGGAGSFDPAFSRADGAFGGGVSLSARWARVGFDLALPLFVVNDPGEETPFFLPWLFFDVNTSFALGQGHSLRVGFLSVAPGVGWQYERGALIVRADLHALGVINVLRTEVGARF